MGRKLYLPGALSVLEGASTRSVPGCPAAWWLPVANKLVGLLVPFELLFRVQSLLGRGVGVHLPGDLFLLFEGPAPSFLLVGCDGNVTRFH